jgi:hypothetical protein
VELLKTNFVLLAYPLGYGKVMSAGGKQLLPSLDGHGPANGSFEPGRLRQALALFQQLPPEQRQPREEDLPAIWRQAGYPQPPSGGVILKLHARTFGLDDAGNVHPFPYFGGSPLLDYLWLTGAEAKALVPGSLREGDSFALPGWFARRFQRYRMLTEPLSGSLPSRVLRRHPERESSLTLTVEAASAQEVRLRLHGSLPIRHTGWDLENRRVPAGDYDCDYEFLGYLTYDRGREAFTRFDLVALGTVRQLGAFRYPKPQAGTLMSGVRFELADGTAAERIPPYGLRTGRAEDDFSHDD